MEDIFDSILDNVFFPCENEFFWPTQKGLPYETAKSEIMEFINNSPEDRERALEALVALENKREAYMKAR